MKYLFFIILLYFCHTSFSQQNLIYNNSFENGIDNFLPTCNYGFSSNQSIDNKIAYWKCAHHNVEKGVYIPTWIDFTSCYKTIVISNCGECNMQSNVLTSNRIMFISSKWFSDNKSFHDAIRVGLKENLKPNQTYIFRIKYNPVMKYCFPKYTDVNHLRIHFTKWGENWNSTSNNNQKWNDAVSIYHTDICGMWKQKEVEITTPNLSNLKNLIIYVEEGAFYIDDVELYEKCQSEIFIQNKVFDYFYNPSLQDYFFVAHASNILNAGYSVDNTEPYGDVIINDGANITFKAQNEINLNSGFTADKGSEFTAVLEPCYTKSLSKDSNSEKIFSYDDPVVINNLHNINDFFINIYPNPFTSSTEIVYNLPEATDLNIYLTNFYSIKVMQVYDSYIAKGMHTISINGTMLQQGVYFCIMETSTQRKVVKVVKM